MTSCRAPPPPVVTVADASASRSSTTVPATVSSTPMRPGHATLADHVSDLRKPLDASPAVAAAAASARLGPTAGTLVHSLWTNLWTTHVHARPSGARPGGQSSAPRTHDDGDERGGPVWTTGQARSRAALWQHARRGPAAQPARLAAADAPGRRSRGHRDHRGAQRLHPRRSSRAGCATVIEDALSDELRPRDPDRRHGQPARCDDGDEPPLDELDRRGRRRHASPTDRRRLDAGPRPARRRPSPTHRPARTSPVRPGAGQPGARASEPSRLNPKYTFETFVIGSSNRFAHAAAVAVAEAPGKAYNPLLVYGDSGLGKTHLLHAIGHYVRSLYTGAKVRYVQLEEFTNEFINAIRDDRQAAFQRRYRDVDVLLVDDIQFLRARSRPRRSSSTPSTPCTTPTSRSCITSDRPPKRLEDARGPAAQPVRVGPDHRRPAARPRDPHRDPAQEGRAGPALRAAGRAGVHRLARSRPTSASSRVR